MRASITIKSFILLAALAGLLAMLAGVYAVVATVYDRTVRAEARNVSAMLAGQTFDAMYQVMRKGWFRAELEEFLLVLRKRFEETPYALEIYRSERVDALFGRIEQPPADAAIAQAFRDGRERVIEKDEALRHIYPLRARDECLLCHFNAAAGDTLGVIDLRQDLRPVLREARGNFLAALWPIVPGGLGGAFVVVILIHRRIHRSVQMLHGRVERVNKVSDLAHFVMDDSRAGFRDLDDILAEVRELVRRLREFAVDKELFEIRLLERFIITSEVVRDWQEYVRRLLVEINEVMEVYVLFTVFKVEEEVFDIEIFWRDRPSAHTTQCMERSVRAVLQRHSYFRDVAAIKVNHNVANEHRDLPSLNESDIELQSKSLFVETPKIGGIVGIGVQTGLGRDPMRLLVMESILSTLLNVVGSVKAIYKYTKELEYYATRDPLTNLYNQRTFWELIEYEMERARRKDERLGLLVIDLDNFKSVNDTYGHTFGDTLLHEFAGLLRRVFRLGDVVARYGGDEFTVLLTDAQENQAWTAAERLVAEASQMSLPAPKDGKPVRITISVGIALFPQHADGAHDLFLIADNMMYQAKHGGKNQVMLAGEQEIAEIYRDIGAQSFAIRTALEEKRFLPYFQPIVSTDSGATPLGVEVLSRMVGEDGEIAAAGTFIEVAERLGVVHKIDYQVMEHAFETARRVGYEGKLFINLSPKALILSEFVPTIAHLIKESGIAPERIVFELTERETVHNMTLLQQFVNDLKMRGFQFAVDDFGAGFSSFHYLKHLPIDYVKIDGEFIINLMHDDRDQIFVHHMASMARDLGIRTIAEFVEDAEVLERVRAAGIDYAQGYYLGRPAGVLGRQPVEARGGEAGAPMETEDERPDLF